MPFFSRPNLDNTQFKQEVDDILTLEGETIIKKLGGLKLNDGTNDIPVIIENPEDGKVLTYNDGKLELLSGGTAGGDAIYRGKPTVTTNIGGYSIGDNISGNTYNEIIQKLLVPTQYPTIIEPTHTFNFYTSNGAILSSANRILEVGSGLVGFNGFHVELIFDRGSIMLGNKLQNYRSGLITSYSYTNFDNTTTTHSNPQTDDYVNSTYTESSSLKEFGSDYKIKFNKVNTIKNTVIYAPGPQPKDSDESNFGSNLDSDTSTISITIEGIYPYFYGVSDVKQTNIDILIKDSSTIKVVKKSNASIVLNYTTNEIKYLWFAIPSSNVGGKIMSKWKVNELNNGNIGTASDLFNEKIDVTVTTDMWSNVSYYLYVSNYPTEPKPMIIS